MIEKKRRIRPKFFIDAKDHLSTQIDFYSDFLFFSYFYQITG